VTEIYKYCNKFKIKNYSNPFFWNASDSDTDKNLSNYNIDSLFKSRFLSGNMINFKPGFFIYFVKLISFSVSATFTSMNSLDANFDFEKARSRKVSRKISGKALELIKVLRYIATYKLTVRNPLNQPLGNRFLAVLRLVAPRYFSWKIRKSKAAEKN
jgi:hypothetical protein